VIFQAFPQGKMRERRAFGQDIESFRARLARPGLNRGSGTAASHLSLLLLSLAVPLWRLPAAAGVPQREQTSGSSIEVVLDAPEADVYRAVENVVSDEIVHGTYVYEREKTLAGAVASVSSSYFGAWKGPGKALYKIYKGALAPRHFKESADIGTISVRYLVQELKDSKTRVEIEAVFVEDGRKKVHDSDGSVESSEMKEIEDRLRDIRLAEQREAEADRERNRLQAEEAARVREREQERARLLAAESSAKSLEEHVSELRHELVRLVLKPGAELKSAPFHSAVNLQTLAPDTEVLVLIVTPYWYGVETSVGRRGWVKRDQVKPLP